MATETKPRKPTKPRSAREAGARGSRRVALVTGASSGIGEAFARQLAARGYAVIMVARRKDRMEATAQRIRAAGNPDPEIIEADLSTPAGVEATLARIAKGDVDMLVNNAGFGTNGEFADMPVERELEEIDLNIRALTQLSHAALQHMKAKKAGTIINVASTGAYQPVPYMSTYAATKAYVLSFSEGLHEEVKHHGVNVMCLCPGGTRTEFQEVAGVDEGKMPRVGWMTADAVVKHALDAAEAGSAIAVPGMLNKSLINLQRVLPRFAVRRISGNMFKK
jgi:hypothetical protein